MQVRWAHRRRCARMILRQVIILISDKISYVECTDGHCQNLKKINTKSIQRYATWASTEKLLYIDRKLNYTRVSASDSSLHTKGSASSHARQRVWSIDAFLQIHSPMARLLPSASRTWRIRARCRVCCAYKTPSEILLSGLARAENSLAARGACWWGDVGVVAKVTSGIRSLPYPSMTTASISGPKMAAVLVP